LFVAGLALAAAAACAVDALLGQPNQVRQRPAGLLLVALAGFSLALTVGVWVVGGQLPPSFAWGTGFILASAVWIGLRLRGRLPASVWLVGLFVLALVDWAGLDRTLFAPRSLQSVLAEGKPAAEYLAARPGVFRVYSPSYSLPQQTAASAGLQLADGVDPLQLASYVAFMQSASGVPSAGYSVTIPPFNTGDPATANSAYRPDAELLGRLNVAYVAAEFDLAVEGLEFEAQFGATRLYRNLLAAPRLWLQPVEATASQNLPAPELFLWSPDRIEIHAQGPALLVLSEIAYPGWQVWVDGAPQPLETFDDLLRAVRLPSGDHRVLFAFRPTSLFLGLAGFTFTALILIAAAWFSWRHSQAKQASEEIV
jgi:hypothetical protein